MFNKGLTWIECRIKASDKSVGLLYKRDSLSDTYFRHKLINADDV